MGVAGTDAEQCRPYLQLLEPAGQLQGTHLDEGVLLRDGSLAGGAVVIRTGLAILGRVHAVPLCLGDATLQPAARPLVLLDPLTVTRLATMLMTQSDVPSPYRRHPALSLSQVHQHAHVVLTRLPEPPEATMTVSLSESFAWMHASELYLLVQGVELPPNKGVVVGVDVCGDEGAPPVYSAAHGADVPHRQRGKVVQPVLRFTACPGLCERPPGVPAAGQATVWLLLTSGAGSACR